jgi:hypothetical protein
MANVRGIRNAKLLPQRRTAVFMCIQSSYNHSVCQEPQLQVDTDVFSGIFFLIRAIRVIRG